MLTSSDFEKRVLKAAGAVQEQTGCPVTFHPGRHTDAPEEIIRIYSEAGGAIDKAVMGHLDSELQPGLSKLVFSLHKENHSREG